MLPPMACNLPRTDTTKEPGSLNQIITSRFPVFKVYRLTRADILWVPTFAQNLLPYFAIVLCTTFFDIGSPNTETFISTATRKANFTLALVAPCIL